MRSSSSDSPSETTITSGTGVLLAAVFVLAGDDMKQIKEVFGLPTNTLCLISSALKIQSPTLDSRQTSHKFLLAIRDALGPRDEVLKGGILLHPITLT